MSLTDSPKVNVIDHEQLADLAAGILDSGYTLRFKAPGFSMVPFIRPGDQIDVRPLGQTQIRSMDILLYRRPAGQVVAHRMVRRLKQDSGMQLVLRADAPPHQQELIEINQVLGRVVNCVHSNQRWQLDSPFFRLLAWLWVITSPLSDLILQCWYSCKKVLRQGDLSV